MSPIDRETLIKKEMLEPNVGPTRPKRPNGEIEPEVRPREKTAAESARARHEAEHLEIKKRATRANDSHDGGVGPGVWTKTPAYTQKQS